MEALFYDHTTTSQAARQADLRQAMQAFLADAASRSAVQLVGLSVHIPVPSAVTAAAHSVSGSRTARGTSASHEDIAVAARGAVADKEHAAAVPPPPATSRRCRTAQKLAWCAWEADRRLRQAAEDAAEINMWIAHGDLSAPLKAGGGRTRSSVGSPVLVPVAFLAPCTRDDLVVYESWQRCAEACIEVPTADVSRGPVSRATRMLSPLRCAGLIALSLGAPSLLLSWAERSARCHLENLLLPHQSLLMDLSWWVEATSERAAGSRVSSAVLRDLFISDVQPSLKLPKGDSRCAVWISYAALLASLHPSLPNSGDGARMKDVSMSERGKGNVSPGRREWGTACGSIAGVDEQAFTTTYTLIRQLLSSLNASRSGAVGRTQLLRVVLSYGGHCSALQRRLVHTCSRTACGPMRADAALLHTRSLVDVHALFGVLAGQDTVHMYNEAAAFVRTARRRASAGQAVQQRHRLIALQSAQVKVTLPTPSTACGTDSEALASDAASVCSNAFVERGARALARKLRRWENKRLGKTGSQGARAHSHVKATKRAMARVQAKACAADSESVLSRAVERAGGAATRGKAGKKRRAELLALGEGCPSADTVEGLSPRRKQRKTGTATLSSTPPIDTALKWSEDVTGSG
ncbi:hypothetical protein LSCM1_00228 [Leishmania martiniquensis]|uniref:Uncharacterized protein n=1 Tax=Leishmania martiniquensis TaxID=1580590 RepID=A0A836KFV8_9TRYP|nr:hypothetical protein LSCM1_00228 [Leishmania martiniquensis]